MKLVSVVIPVYNREKTIKRCVESVLQGTYQNVEVIIVDDCSTDNTVKILSQLKDSRIRIIRMKKKGGAQAARNRGIIEANGEWIAFLDSDDIWGKNKLEIQLKELEAFNYDPYIVIHSNCFCYDEETNKKWVWYLPKTEGLCYNLLLKRPSPMFQGILTSKKALLEIGLLDESIISYQEWDTSIRLSKRCRFIHINKPLFTYVFHSGETISKNKRKEIDGYFQIVKKFEDLLKEKGYFKMHIMKLIIKSIEYDCSDIQYKLLSMLKLTKFRENLIQSILDLSVFSKRLKKYLVVMLLMV